VIGGGPTRTTDVVLVGAGHNSLVAAILLARDGCSVVVLERGRDVCGAAVSAQPFAGVDVSISRYAYLLSLFPTKLISELGLRIELRRRRVASCTPRGGSALVVDARDPGATRRSFRSMGLAGDWVAWLDWQALVGRIASVVAPTLMDPLRPADDFRATLGEEAWAILTGRPLGETLSSAFESDLLRGVVLTDGLIGTFAHSREGTLRQNRCFLYHVVGNGTGDWLVPVGGMGTLSRSLLHLARQAGVDVRTEAPVVSIEADGRTAEVVTDGGDRYRASAVLCGAAPSVLSHLLGDDDQESRPEGAQVKINMVLRRLPRHAADVEPRTAFPGPLPVNESMTQLDAAWAQATAGALPTPVPCELYSHSLSDDSIMAAELRARGVQTVSLFALQAPTRLFSDSSLGSGAVTSDLARQACLASLESVLGEPLSDCLLSDAEGRPCIEIHTPIDLERELALPGGNIFHGDLRWPWAEEDREVGRWGVETGVRNVFLCGSGSRRGGAVSGLGGHHAAMATRALLARAR